MSTYLTADRFGPPTNAKNYTISVWFKLSKNTNNHILSYNYGNGQRGFDLIVRSNDQTLRVEDFTAGVTNYVDIRTNRVFRDYSAWYHIVVAYDSTQSTAADRVKLYVNGTQETSLAASTYPSQDLDSFIATTPQNNKGFLIGSFYNSSGNIDAGNYFAGYMSQFIFVDGTAYAASTFGSTNANGIWVPNSQPSVTYGTNGFKLDFEGTGTAADASGFGADSSGNNNNFASTGLGTNPSTSDTPLNIFCTLNSLQQTTAITLSNGSLVATNTSNDQGAAGTMAFSAGKWYWEVKLVNKVETGINLDSNILQLSNDGTLGSNDSNLKQTALVTNRAGGPNDFRFNGSTETVNSTACSNGDILMVAVDADNTKIYYGKNGTWMNSGDPAGGTGELKNFSSGYTAGNFITPTFQNGIGATASCQFNFGNSPFTIASGNADANGYGNFEYAVPSGYYALCTKNLALYGG